MTFNKKCIQRNVSLRNPLAKPTELDSEDLRCKAVPSVVTRLVLSVFPSHLLWAWLAQGVPFLGPAAQPLVLIFPDLEQTSKPTTNSYVPNAHSLLSAAGKPKGNGPQVPRRTGGAATDFSMPAPSHQLPGDSLARGAVGDLISQLISLLFGVSAGSLRGGKFLNKFRP